MARQLLTFENSSPATTLLQINILWLEDENIRNKCDCVWNRRDDTSWVGGNSEHAGKSRGIQNVCVRFQFRINVCCDKTCVLSQRNVSPFYFSRQMYLFNILRNIKATSLQYYFAGLSNLNVLVYSPPYRFLLDYVNPASHLVCRHSVKSMRELSGKQPVGALMKVTRLPYREVKLLHLAITTWGHTAGMALEMTVR